MSEEIIKKLIEIFSLENQAELAKFLGVDRGSVSRWKRVGFHKSSRIITEKLIELIVKEK